VDGTARESDPDRESESDREQRDKEFDAACEALIRVYLIADKLQDVITTNMAIDELVRLGDILIQTPNESHVSLAYSRTTENSPLRLLMRDSWAYEIAPSEVGQLNDIPGDFIRDIAVEIYRVMGEHENDGEQTIQVAFSKKVSDKTDEDKCHYHQHDYKHPRRVAKETPS
jgi:hypothetical protein